MEKDKINSILIADDEASALSLCRSLSQDYDVFSVGSGEECLSQVSSRMPDLILLSLVSPEMKGLDILKALKEDDVTRNIPTLLISSPGFEESVEKGLLLGALDCINKPFKDALVKARIHTYMQLLRQLHTIENFSLLDPLTETLNYRGFVDRLNLEWARALRGQRPISFLLLDVDKFGKYNEAYGYCQGDALLKTLAELLNASAKRPLDITARLDGGEFGILLPDTTLEGALDLAERVRLAAEGAQVPAGETMTSATVSVGVITLIPAEDISADDMISTARTYLKTAKSKGGNQIYNE